MLLSFFIDCKNTTYISMVHTHIITRTATTVDNRCTCTEGHALRTYMTNKEQNNKLLPVIRLPSDLPTCCENRVFDYYMQRKTDLISLKIMDGLVLRRKTTRPCPNFTFSHTITASPMLIYFFQLFQARKFRSNYQRMLRFSSNNQKNAYR